MQLQDIFKKLSHGELSSLDIGQEGAGSIQPEDQDRILTHVGNALEELYSRFVLKRAHVEIQTMPGIFTYVLSPEHNVSDTSPTNTAPRYILDHVQNRFTGDVVKVLDCYRRDDPLTPLVNEYQPYGVNSRSTKAGIEIFAYNAVWFADPPIGAIFRIEYQAEHPALLRPISLTQEIQLPPILREALLLRIAAGVFSGMSGPEHVAKSEALFNRFEKACALVDMKDLSQESTSDETDRLRDKGFI